MLNRIEKKELLEDAFNVKRREDFRKGKLSSAVSSASLDTYIQFLSKVHNVFSSFDITRQQKLAAQFYQL